MNTALAVLLILIGLEGLVLIVCPAQVRRIIGETAPVTLRVIGILELVLVALLVVFGANIL